MHEKWDGRLELGEGHRGHLLRIAAEGTIFCTSRGKFSTSRLGGLLQECPRRAKPSGARALDCFARGLHPSGRVVGYSARLVGAAGSDEAGAGTCSLELVAGEGRAG